MTSSVVPLAPAAGWEAADSGRRLAALLALPLAALLSLADLQQPHAVPGWAILGWLVVGPACFYSLARVLRPEVVVGERSCRHLLASAATAFAVPTIADLQHAELGLRFLYGPPAFVLGVVTTLWGLAALASRLVVRPAALAR